MKMFSPKQMERTHVRCYGALGRAGFTMIEIAISLAVIGFALVAIIGILPTGMSVQKENRQETIINQDFSVWMDAFRSGARGVDDLTNYVVAITNSVTLYDNTGRTATPYRDEWYTRTASWPIPSGAGAVQFPLINGARIIGLLGTPKIMWLPPDGKGGSQGFLSNHVVAYARSLSGPANEKAPQTNLSVQELALSYRMISDIVPVPVLDPWQGSVPPAANTNDHAAHSNYWAVAKNLQTNLHEIRLTFRWPHMPGGNLGSGRQVFRTSVSGSVLETNEDNYPVGVTNLLHFFQPRSYVKAP